MLTLRFRASLLVALAGMLLAVALPVPAQAQQEASKRADPAQIARGAKAWSENCGRCHNIRDPRDLNDEDWDVSVTHMRVRAGLPGNVARDIKVFLKNSN